MGTGLPERRAKRHRQRTGRRHGTSPLHRDGRGSRDGLPRVTATGGGAASALALQIRADVFDMPVLTLENDESGKTELWYVVDAEPGATLIHGVNRPVTKVELRQRIEDGTILEVCNRIPARPGDVHLIEAGTLHSVGAGVTLAEIQQNANTTYRVYDYGRLGRDGKPRDLQIDRALDVLHFAPTPSLVLPPPQDFFAEYTVRQLFACDFFTVDHIALDGRIHLFTGRTTFHSLLLLEGILELEYASGKEILEKGDSFFVPAGLGPYWLRGHGKLLLTMV